MGRAAQAGRGVASAAKPRRAAALAGVGREGRLADAPLIHGQGPLPRLYGAPESEARINGAAARLFHLSQPCV